MEGQYGHIDLQDGVCIRAWVLDSNGRPGQLAGKLLSFMQCAIEAPHSLVRYRPSCALEASSAEEAARLHKLQSTPWRNSSMR